MAAALVSGSMVAELILQAGVLIVVLGARRGDPARWGRLALAGTLSLPLAAPVLAGAWAMAVDSAREARFAPEVALSWSLHPLELPAVGREVVPPQEVDAPRRVPDEVVRERDILDGGPRRGAVLIPRGEHDG